MDGNKTYVTAVATILGAIALLATGNLDAEVAGQTIVAALLAIFIRSGIKKAEPPTK